MSRGLYLSRTAGGTKSGGAGGDRGARLSRGSGSSGSSSNIQARKQAADTMKRAGIGSLSGRTTDTKKGSTARDIQRDYLADKTAPGGGITPAEDFMLDPLDFSASPGIYNQLMETKGDPLKQSIVSNILRGKPPKETGTFVPSGIDTFIDNIINRAKETDFTFPGVFGAFQNLTKELRPTADSFKNKNFLATLENEFRKGNFNRDEYYSTYKDLIDEAFNIKDEEAAMGRSKDIFDTQTVGAFNEAVAGDLGSSIQQRVDPIGFGRELLDRGGPQTSGQAEEFAKIDLSQLTNSPEDRRLAAAIMEARALVADKQSRQDANMGIMAASPALPGLPGLPVIPPGTTPPVKTLTPAPVPNILTQPFDINKFYASLPQYTQQGIMNPNLAQFYQNLGMFPGMNV